jgi:glutamate formiminotransferase
MKILQCVPNFSEGRDPDFLEELAAALKQFPVKVLDLSKDKDHNRADTTFLGAPDAVEAAAMAVTSRALELIDMRKHKGSHPRMGAVDGAAARLWRSAPSGRGAGESFGQRRQILSTWQRGGH